MMVCYSDGGIAGSPEMADNSSHFRQDGVLRHRNDVAAVGQIIINIIL